MRSCCWWVTAWSAIKRCPSAPQAQAPFEQARPISSKSQRQDLEPTALRNPRVCTAFQFDCLRCHPECDPPTSKRSGTQRTHQSAQVRRDRRVRLR